VYIINARNLVSVEHGTVVVCGNGMKGRGGSNWESSSLALGLTDFQPRRVAAR